MHNIHKTLSGITASWSTWKLSMHDCKWTEWSPEKLEVTPMLHAKDSRCYVCSQMMCSSTSWPCCSVLSSTIQLKNCAGSLLPKMSLCRSFYVQPLDTSAMGQREQDRDWEPSFSKDWPHRLCFWMSPVNEQEKHVTSKTCNSGKQDITLMLQATCISSSMSVT